MGYEWILNKATLFNLQESRKKMNIIMNRILITAFVFMLFLQACQKNIEGFKLDEIQAAAEPVWQNNISPNAPVVALKNDLRKPQIIDSFSYNNAGTFFLAGNLSLLIPANGLASATGILPNGIIKRESLLILKKGDFISMSMPTISNGRLLVSGGAYFLGLKNNNVDLLVAQGKKLNLHYSTNAAPSAGMKIFNGMEDSMGDFNWVLNTDTFFSKVNPALNGYEVHTNRLKWLHTARFSDSLGTPQTSLTLKLPPNYTNTNTVAYISFNDQQSVAGVIGNAATRTFVSGNLPVNRQVTVVVISKQAGDYYLGKVPANTSVTSAGVNTQEIVITPVITPLPAVKMYLESL